MGFFEFSLIVVNIGYLKFIRFKYVCDGVMCIRLSIWLLFFIYNVFDLYEDLKW